MTQDNHTTVIVLPALAYFLHLHITTTFLYKTARVCTILPIIVHHFAIKITTNKEMYYITAQSLLHICFSHFTQHFGLSKPLSRKFFFKRCTVFIMLMPSIFVQIFFLSVLHCLHIADAYHFVKVQTQFRCRRLIRISIV